MYKCMQCHKPCRKMYRMSDACYNTLLVCKKCITDYPKASHCARCGKPLRGIIYFTYDCDGAEADPHHRECFLQVVEADEDDLEEAWE